MTGAGLKTYGAARRFVSAALPCAFSGPTRRRGAFRETCWPQARVALPRGRSPRVAPREILHLCRVGDSAFCI